MTQKNVKGILGTKLGMTQVFDENNRVVPVTVVKAGPCVITGIRTEETDGYNAVQIAFGAIDPRKVTKPVAGQFEKAGATPRRHMAELRLENAEQASGFEIGQEISAEMRAGLDGLAGQLEPEQPLAEALGQLLFPREIEAMRKRLQRLLKGGKFPGPSGQRSMPWPPV